jgi:hypothetical protein
VTLFITINLLKPNFNSPTFVKGIDGVRFRYVISAAGAGHHPTPYRTSARLGRPETSSPEHDIPPQSGTTNVKSPRPTQTSRR